MTPIPAGIASIQRPVERLLHYYFFKALATTAAFPVTIVVFYIRYHTMRYRFDEEGIRMSWGILFRHEVMLNYSKIQDIHLRSDFVERWLGLARIQVQTAGASGGSEVVLEGIPGHEAMRDFLYSRMRGAKDAHEEHPADPVAAALGEVASEMRAIRTLLEQRRV